jgi:hypothetical protein
MARPSGASGQTLNVLIWIPRFTLTMLCGVQFSRLETLVHLAGLLRQQSLYPRLLLNCIAKTQCMTVVGPKRHDPMTTQESDGSRKMRLPVQHALRGIAVRSSPELARGTCRVCFSGLDISYEAPLIGCRRRFLTFLTTGVISFSRMTGNDLPVGGALTGDYCTLKTMTRL